MEQWFDQKTAGIIGALIGCVLGSTGALMGCCCNTFVRKGWKKFSLIIFTTVIAVCVILIITGIVAAANEQPYHVWYPLLFPGFIGTAIFSSLFPIVRKRFTESELRKLQSKDL